MEISADVKGEFAQVRNSAPHLNYQVCHESPPVTSRKPDDVPALDEALIKLFARKWP